MSREGWPKVRPIYAMGGRTRPKGSPKTPGSGRKKGAPNKFTRDSRLLTRIHSAASAKNEEGWADA